MISVLWESASAEAIAVLNMIFKLYISIILLTVLMWSQKTYGNTVSKDSVPAAVKDGKGMLIFYTSKELLFTELEQQRITEVLKGKGVNIARSASLSENLDDLMDGDSLDFFVTVMRVTVTHTPDDKGVGFNENGFFIEGEILEKAMKEFMTAFEEGKFDFTRVI